jgi:DNA-binding NarL/FixJ family response regulator
VKKNILLFNFSNLQSEGLILLFERNEIYKVKLLSTTSEIDIEKKSWIEKLDVLINGNLEKTENTSQKLMHIKSINPEIKIITIGKDYDQELIEALSISDVFLDESIDFGFLLKAIETVISDGYFIDPKAAPNYIKLLNDENPKHTHLTKREVEVLRLICSDKTSKEIGSIMNISSRTVENHRENLLKKTGSRGTAGLLIYAIKNDLFKISLDD